VAPVCDCVDGVGYCSFGLEALLTLVLVIPGLFLAIAAWVQGLGSERSLVSKFSWFGYGILLATILLGGAIGFVANATDGRPVHPTDVLLCGWTAAQITRAIFWAILGALYVVLGVAALLPHVALRFRWGTERVTVQAESSVDDDLRRVSRL
jgi:hypothetical protein